MCCAVNWGRTGFDAWRVQLFSAEPPVKHRYEYWNDNTAELGLSSFAGCALATMDNVPLSHLGNIIMRMETNYIVVFEHENDNNEQVQSPLRIREGTDRETYWVPAQRAHDV